MQASRQLPPNHSLTESPNRPYFMKLQGVVIGVIVVLMYLPVFELAGSIQ